MASPNASRKGASSPDFDLYDPVSVCDFSIALESGIQDFSLCIHGYFDPSEDPIGIHLGRDAVSLKKPPPLHRAQYVYDVGTLNRFGDMNEYKPAEKWENIDETVEVNLEEVAANKAYRTVDPSWDSQFDSSFSVCELAIHLPTGNQRLHVCIDDGFHVSDNPIVLHLDGNGPSLGKLPHLHDARYRYNLGLLDLLGDTDQDELVGVARDRRQQKKQKGRLRGINWLHNLRMRPNAQIKRHVWFWLAVAIALLAVGFAAPKFRLGPAAEYPRLVKPLDPSPEEPLADLMQRYAAVSSAVLNSGATDRDIYNNLLWTTDAYCARLQSALAEDWARSLYASRFSGWRQTWASVTTRWQDYLYDQEYYGPTHARVQALCDDFKRVLVPMKRDIAGKLHDSMKFGWPYHSAYGLLFAANEMAEIFKLVKDDNTTLLDSGEAHTTPSATSTEAGWSGDKTISGPLAIQALQVLSHILNRTQEFSRSGTENMHVLNTSLDRVVTLGAQLLEPTWDEWAPRAQTKQPSKRDLRRLRNLRDESRAGLIAVKNVQNRFLGPATAAIALTGTEFEQAMGQMDSVVAGGGCTGPVENAGQQVLGCYCLSFRHDLPAWLFSLAQGVALRTPGFWEGAWEETYAREQARRKPDWIK